MCWLDTLGNSFKPIEKILSWFFNHGEKSSLDFFKYKERSFSLQRVRVTSQGLVLERKGLITCFVRRYFDFVFIMLGDIMFT